MKTRFIGGAVLVALSLLLAAPEATADKLKLDDKRGDVHALDIAHTKLNNGTHRLVGSVRLTRKSMRPRGHVMVWLRYHKPRVGYGLELSWNKKRRLKEAYSVRLKK